MVELTGSDTLIEALKKENVNVVFGIPGGAIMPVYDAIYESGIKHILVRHEQSAAHMADGFARAGKEPGVCMATSGPGATNLVTGIGTAFADSSPVIAITGQVPQEMIGKDAFQETDTIGILTPVTKYAFQPTKPNEIPEMVKKSFYIASTGRPGPVLIDIPKDVQVNKAEIEFKEKVEVRGYNPKVTPDKRKIEQAAEILLNSERPMIWGGGGVLLSDGAEQLQTIANLLIAPVITTLKGKGAFPENHPLCLGPIGMHGTPEANKAVLEADCLLAVGVRFSDRSTGKFEEFMKDGKIIHIDIDPSELGKNKEVNVSIVGDVKMSLIELFTSLKRKINKKEDSIWIKRIEEIKNSFDQKESPDSEQLGVKVVKKIREILPPEAILTTGVGKHQMWCELFYKVIKPRTWITSTGYGTMGFGLPAAIGAKVAKPGVPVVNLDGDGSFMMTENSLAVCTEENIPVISVVLNNNSLGLVEQWQRIFFNERYSAVKFKSVPDITKLSEAYGVEAIRNEDVEGFEKAFKYAVKSEYPTVIEMIISPEEDVYPFVAPGVGLKDIIYGREK